MRSKTGNKRTKAKTDLGRKLFEEHKKMPTEVRTKWSAWRKVEAPEMTEATWYQIVIGAYISRDNIKFATLALRKGKELNAEFKRDLDRIRV